MSARVRACSGCSISGLPKAWRRWRNRVPGQSQRAMLRHGADRVPGAGDVEHRRDLAHAVLELAQRPGRHAIQMDLGGGQLARAQLVLEPVDGAARASCRRASRGLDVEQRQARRRPSGAPAPGRHSPTMAEVNHLRPYSRHWPSASRRAMVSVLADIGTAGGLGHPLPGQPQCIGVAAEEMRQRALGQCLIAGGRMALAAPSVMASGQV